MIRISRLLILTCTLLVQIVKAQTPTYQLKIANETQPSPFTFEFDVFILSTGETPLELANLGFGLGIDCNVKNGGTLSASIIPGSSELPDKQQPVKIMMATANSTSTKANCGSCDGTGITYNYMNVPPRINPGYGKGTIISNIDGGCKHPGTKVARFRITNTKKFTTGSKMNMVWSAINAFEKANTIVSAYVDGIATSVTVTPGNLNWNSPGTCAANPALNKAK